jgi:hypothetical protein
VLLIVFASSYFSDATAFFSSFSYSGFMRLATVFTVAVTCFARVSRTESYCFCKSLLFRTTKGIRRLSLMAVSALEIACSASMLALDCARFFIEDKAEMSWRLRADIPAAMWDFRFAFSAASSWSKGLTQSCLCETNGGQKFDCWVSRNRTTSPKIQ